MSTIFGEPQFADSSLKGVKQKIPAQLTMSRGIDQLLLKSSLDFFAAMAFATSLGWGVAASIIPVGIYQGFWTLVGLFLGEVMSGYQIDAMTVVGGVLLLSIGLRLLNIKSVAVGNLLPALVMAPVIAMAAHSFI